MTEHPHQTKSREGIGEQENTHERDRTHAEKLNRLGQGQESTQGQETHQPGTTNNKSCRGRRHPTSQATQLGDVLAIGRRNHATDAHRQQRLRYGVGEQQQQSQNRNLQRDGNEHQTQMGGCCVRLGALDVHLGDGHQRAADGADAADHQQHPFSNGGELQDWHHLEQDDRPAGDHHGIAQDGSWVGPLHRFIQPQVHRELGALACGAGDQPKPQQRCRQGGKSILRGPGVEVVEPHGTGITAEGHHTHQQEHIANTLGEEGIPRCRYH